MTEADYTPERHSDDQPSIESLPTVADMLGKIGARIRSTETFIPNKNAVAPQPPAPNRHPEDLGIDHVD